MQLSHTVTRTSVAFDDPNLVSAAGLVPVLAWAEPAGLRSLADEHLSVPTDRGANAGLKVVSLVAGMVAGADSIDDMALLRHGGMGRVFARAYAPSTLGSFLRASTFGHVRELDAVASRFLLALAGPADLAPPALAAGGDDGEGAGGYALVDVDDTIIEVHGHAKQGAGFGYTRVRGLNALIATFTTDRCALLVVAQRLRKGSCGSPRGAKRLIADAVKQARRLLGPSAPILVRMDSAYYGRGPVHAATTGARTCRSPSGWTRRSRPRSPASPMTRGPRSSTRTRSSTRPPARGSPRRRSPRSRSPRSPPRRRPTGSPDGSSYAASPTCTPTRNAPPDRAPCSTCGASTRSSPPPPRTDPPGWTPSRRTAPTAGTRSSNRSTPTSRAPRLRTCPRLS